MKSFTLAVITLALVGSAACSNEDKPRPTDDEAAKMVESPAPQAYTLVFLKTGPKSGQLSVSENQEAFAGHFANMGRLAEEHKLVMAGPFGKQRHDELLRGLFVINSAQREEATAWASTDPAVQAGVFVLEYHDFATDAPLVAALDRDLAISKKAEEEGRKLSPGDGARSYVLLTVEQQELARRELTPLMEGGGVFLLARLDADRALAILDAQNVAEAQERYGAVLDRLGEHSLDDWFATGQLAHLREH